MPSLEAVLDYLRMCTVQWRVALLGLGLCPVAGEVVGVEGCLWYLTVAGSAPGVRRAPGALMLPLPNASGFDTQGTLGRRN